MKRILIAVALFMYLTGCSSLQKSADEQGPDTRLHTLYIDKDGNLLDPMSGQLVSNSDDYEVVDKAEKQYTKNIIENFEALQKDNPSLRLTLFIHGGLNAFKGATRRSQTFTAAMLADGQYPVFICWDSGPFTNYFDHLFRIRKGLSAPIGGAVSSPIVLLEDTTRSLSRFPAAVYKEINDPLTVSKTIKTGDEYDYEKRSAALQKLGFSISNKGPYVGVGSSYWTVMNPVKLVTAPFVDGLGSGSWQSMLRRADLVLTKKQAYEGEIPAAKSKQLDEPEEQSRYADTAATKFLTRWTKRTTLQSVKVNLIGHSMGAIVATDILVRHPTLNIDNLVFMGAAARVKDVENVVVPWMQSPAHERARFFNLSLDPYREISENVYYDFLPRGSLLNWIDNIFGSVNSYKDRTAGSWWNIVRTAEDIFPAPANSPQLRNRVQLTRFSIGNGDTGPQTHGDFGKYCFWRSGFWTNESPQLPYPLCAR